MTALGAPVGSRLRLGDAEFRVSAVLTLEPERGVGFFNIAPRLMMHVDDVAATGLIRPGSRVWYYLYAAGNPEPLAAFESWAKARLERGQRIDNLESGRPEVRAAIDRAERYLGLTALLAAVLAGVAIALATRRFVERHLDGCAVMRCLGATQAKLVRLFGVEFLLLGVASSAVGLAIGYGMQFLVATTLESLMRASLPLPSAMPGLQGMAVGLVLLLGFALPPLLQLKNVPAVRVMRRESGAPRGGVLGAYAAGLGTLAALLIWQAGDLKLGVTVVGGFAAALAVFFVVAWGALKLVTSRFVVSRIRNKTLRYGLANLRRHSRSNAVQVASLSLGLTAVLLLTFTHQDLVDAWRRSAPPDAPNRFVVGVQPDQVAAVKDFFASRGIAGAEFNPMVRGRLTAVNGTAVSEADFADERAKRLVEREFNLSYMDAAPGHNLVTAGRWFKPGDKEVSAEEGIARTLGWKLGDRLTFTVAGETFERAAHLAAQAALGLDAGELLRHRAAEPAAELSGDLRQRLSRRGQAARGARRARRALLQPRRGRHRRRGAPGAGRDRSADQRGALPLRLHPQRRAAGPLLGAGRHRGRAPPRGGGDARLRRLARPGRRAASAPSSSPWACSPASSPPSARRSSAR